MKKFTILLFVVFNFVFAFDAQTTLKVYTKILTSIFPQQNTIKVYIPNKEFAKVLNSSDIINVVDNINEASIAIVTTIKELQEVKAKKTDKIVFATKEGLLNEGASVIGAFYWKKGRSQLVFIKSRLKKYHIKLPNVYDKFIIEL